MNDPITPEETASAGAAVAYAEKGRLRLYASVMLAWCAGGLGAVSLLPGPEPGRQLAYLGVVIAGLGYALLARVTGRSKDVDSPAVAFVAILHTVGSALLSIALGAYSPFLAIVAIGQTVHNLSTPRRAAVLSYGSLALALGSIQCLVHFGWGIDYGLLASPPSGEMARIVTIVGTQIALATTYALARLGRREYGRVVERFEEAVRRVARREALIREAREALVRAGGLGHEGRYSRMEIGGYRLGVVLGRGGMGEVYEATRSTDGMEAAVKVLRRDIAEDSAMVRRFELESRIVATLRSPHVVEVYAIGASDVTVPFIAMERLRGIDLATRLRDHGRLELHEAARMVEEVCRGLAVAHAAGVVHRDLKPHNLFLADTPDGPRWKILDFGISKLLGGGQETLTRDAFVGTPSYMAPEQVAGTELDGRADLYALASVLYRALTGEPTFSGPNVARVIRRVVEEMPRDPSTLREMPESVTAVLRIGLAKTPDDRFADAGELAQALRDAVDGRLSREWIARARALDAHAPWTSAASDDEDTP